MVTKIHFNTYYFVCKYLFEGEHLNVKTDLNVNCLKWSLKNFLGHWFGLTTVMSYFSLLASLLKQRVKFWLLGLQCKPNVQCTWRIFQWMLIHVLWNLAAVSTGINLPDQFCHSFALTGMLDTCPKKYMSKNMLNVFRGVIAETSTRSNTHCI